MRRARVWPVSSRNYSITKASLSYSALTALTSNNLSPSTAQFVSTMGAPMMMFLILIFADWNEVHTTRGFVWLSLAQA